VTTKATDTPAGPDPSQEPAPLSEAQISALLAHLSEKARPHASDVAAFWRELPRLLAEGHEGRWALVADGRVLGVWDTFSGASEAGYERFGPDHPFLTPRIARRDLDRLAVLAATGGAPGGAACPS
jgi:hypothetical protein